MGLNFLLPHSLILYMHIHVCMYVYSGSFSFFMDFLILYNQSVLCASLQNVNNSASTAESFLRVKV